MVPEVEVVKAAIERPEVVCAVLAPTERMRLAAVARVRRALDEAGARYGATNDGRYLSVGTGSQIHFLSANGVTATRGLSVDGVLWIVDGVPAGAVEAALPSVRRGGALVVAA